MVVDPHDRGAQVLPAPMPSMQLHRGWRRFASGMPKTPPYERGDLE
jgi:hypothetical protein